MVEATLQRRGLVSLQGKALKEESALPIKKVFRFRCYSCDTHHLFEITDRSYALLDIHKGHEGTLRFKPDL